MFVGESRNGQCRILACGENSSSLKCYLNAAEVAHHHWELILNLSVWKVRDFQLFTSNLSRYSFKKLLVLFILKLKHFDSFLFA